MACNEPRLRFACLISLLLAAASSSATPLDSNWSVPLYIFYSKGNDDVALLSSAPEAGDYRKINALPVAFAHSLQPAKHPLATLRAYWSEERSDLQTSTSSLEELNKHGGNYTHVGDVGLLATDVGPGVSAKGFSPLWLSYDDDRTDGATSPLSFADLNDQLAATAAPSSAFRFGHLAGFAARGEAEFSNVSMSESWPSVGGADCAFECASGTSSRTLIYHWDHWGTGPARTAFNEQMEAAGTVLNSFGPATASSGTKLHISFGYWCCYTDTDHATIAGVLADFQWPKTNVSFDRPKIRIDSSGSTTADHYSFILMLDTASQAALGAIALDVEAAVRQAGVDVHVPRADQEPFHSTLAVVDGTSYPSVAALAAVSEAVAPGNWTAGAGPVQLISPLE